MWNHDFCRLVLALGAPYFTQSAVQSNPRSRHPAIIAHARYTHADHTGDALFTSLTQPIILTQFSGHANTLANKHPCTIRDQQIIHHGMFA
jgi:hypothetical protein